MTLFREESIRLETFELERDFVVIGLPEKYPTNSLCFSIQKSLLTVWSAGSPAMLG
jgi:hypothetical protein